MGKETNALVVAAALVTCLAAYAQLHYGVWQKFHGEGGMRHDLHTSRHKDHLWDGFHRHGGGGGHHSSFSPTCPPCDDACGGGGGKRAGGGDVSADDADDAPHAAEEEEEREEEEEDSESGGGTAAAAAAGATRGKTSSASASASSSKASAYKSLWQTPGLATEAKDLETIALKEELRIAKERVEELTALISIKCVVKDFTQCASACAHRIMRHKQFLAQCHRSLQHRGCPDPALQTARVLAKGGG